MIALGRPNRQGKVTKVPMSLFQAVALKNLMDEVFDQIENYGEFRNNKLIPFFNGNYKRAFQTPHRNAAAFWEELDLDLGTMKARLSFDTQVGLYRLYVLSPADVAPGTYKNWVGPQLSFLTDGMKTLRSTITAARHEEV